MTKSPDPIPPPDHSKWGAKTARRNRWMRSFIIGPLVVGVVFWVLGVAIGIVPFRIVGMWEWPSPEWPPGPALEVSWISGTVGWAVVLLTLGSTFLAIRVQRGQKRNLEPLALIAICVAVLGHAQAIHGALVLFNKRTWPVHLIEVAIGILYLAAALGVIAWGRMLFAASPARGRLMATCTIICSLCSAWIVHTFLVDCWTLPAAGDGIELPVVGYSRRISFLDARLYADLVIPADGSISDTPIKKLPPAGPHSKQAPRSYLRG